MAGLPSSLRTLAPASTSSYPATSQSADDAVAQSATSAASTLQGKFTAMGSSLGASQFKVAVFTAKQIQNENAMAVAASCVSIIAALVSFYWFFRMRRSFRHHLIMLLITSDLTKALWYLVYPLTYLAKGGVSSNSRFCQASGFLLEFSLEASDFATLMIAIHAALYIFKPHAHVEEVGLYSYRYYAYTAWICLPLLMASLAFLNPSGAYAATGTYCYLPVRPFWYRLALAWIPRYIIFFTIALLYVSIYIYVRRKFHRFYLNTSEIGSSQLDRSERRRSRLSTGSKGLGSSHRKQNASMMPRLSTHGTVIEEGRQSISDEWEPLEAPTWGSYRLGSVTPIPPASSIPLTLLSPLEKSRSRSAPAAVNSQTDRNDRLPTAIVATDFAVPAIGASILGSLPDKSPKTRSKSVGLSINALPLPPHNSSRTCSEQSPMTDEFSVWGNTTQGVVTALRDSRIDSLAPTFIDPFSANSSKRPSAGTIVDSKLASSKISSKPQPESPVRSDLPPHNADITIASTNLNENLRTRHAAIMRQLRLRFIYPHVYVLMWTVPFISHCLNYTDWYASQPSYVLNCFGVIILCLQCFVDALLFTIREKPWRHVGDGSLRGSLVWWADPRTNGTPRPSVLGHDGDRDLEKGRSGAGVSKRGQGRRNHKRTKSFLSMATATSFKSFATWPRLWRPSEKTYRGGVKTRLSPSQFAAARLAKKRREAEILDQEQAADENREKRKQSLVERDGRERSWWEVEGKRRKDSVLLGIMPTTSRSGSEEGDFHGPMSPGSGRLAFQGASSKVNPQGVILEEDEGSRGATPTDGVIGPRSDTPPAENEKEKGRRVSIA